MKLRNELDLRDARRTWRSLQVLSSLQRQGLFRELSVDQSRSAGVLAERIGCDPRLLGASLDLIVASELLIYDSDGYRLAPHATAVLTALEEASHEFTQLAQFDEALRSGRPFVETIGGVAVHDAQEARRFLAGMHRRSQASVPEAVRAVRRAWERQGHSGRGPRVLDLGGGHGCFAAAFARDIAGAEATLFDQPTVVPIARGLSGDGFRALGGDYLADALGGPYDVIFMSNVLHGESDAVARQLLRRAREALAPGGCVVLRDRFLADDRSGPSYVADFAITLALNTPQGRPRTLREAFDALRSGGFTHFEKYEAARDEYGYLTATIGELS